MMGEWLSRLRFLVQGKSRDEVDEELQFHLEREAEANRRRGMAPSEASREAAIAFGGREHAREQCREARPAWLIESLLRDLRYGVRGLARNPGFTATAILTLALAIGANATIFSLLDQALIRALPVRDPGELMVLSFAGDVSGQWHSEGGSSPGHVHEFSYPMYRDLRDKSSVLSGLVASASNGIGITWNGRSEVVSAELVSGNYFDVLGIRPATGRLLEPSDETAPGANAVAVVSFDYWKAHLAEATVTGKTLLVNGTPFVIVGVAPPGFHSVTWGRMPAIYIPVTMQHIAQPERDYLNLRNAYWLDLVGRRRSGVTMATATGSLNQLFLSLRAEEFKSLRDQSAKERKEFLTEAHLNLDAGAQGFSPIRDDLKTPLTIVMGMVLLVIAMSVVNVASLLLVRAATRVREFSVRYALGATNGQILRQLFAEGMLIGLAGAAVGLIIAPEAQRVLIRWMAGRSPDSSVFTVSLDWRVIACTMGATLVASVLFSFAPATQFWKPNFSDSLKQQTRDVSGSMHFRRTCVALQIGFSLLLVIGAGLFVRTIQNLRNVDPGFATDHLLSFDLAPQRAGYSSTAVWPVERKILDAVAGLPGVRAVGATNDPDLAGDNVDGSILVPGYTPKPNEDLSAELAWVSDGYLQTLGVPILAGRDFNASDTATSQKVAIVNQKLAVHLFGSATAALGHHVSRPHSPETDAAIVGVARDIKHSSVRDAVVPTVYIPFVQASRPAGLTFYVRTWQAPDAAANGVRAAVANIDPKLVIGDLITMKEQIDDTLLGERTIAFLATVFGLVATLLAGIGLYGILAYSTAQRTREIGIRMALGARRTAVIGLIVREVLLLAGSAIAITLPLAILATREVKSQLYGVSVAEPAVYMAAILVIGLVAALAAVIPARRASTVDPARSLRTE
ncbi:MAG TPA: ABC transporter permease [Terracidiphilus sp.]|nr:ABC transporter permease [Terracidiphilus sp.]